MRQHARRLGVGTATVRRAVAKLGGKSLVRVERPLLTPAIRAKRLERCQRLKSAPVGRVIIFSDEKTWTVDPVNPLDYAYWPHIEAKACRVRHPNITALKASVVRPEGAVQWTSVYHRVDCPSLLI
jgi:hypothetical protein